MAQKGDEFEEIRLPAKAVISFRKMNEQKRSEQFDVAFLKAMLIGFCTLKKTKEEDSIDEKIRNVIESRVKNPFYSFILNLNKCVYLV